MDDDDHFSEIVERSPIQGHDNLIISWLENVHFQSPKKMLKIILGGCTVGLVWAIINPKTDSGRARPRAKSVVQKPCPGKNELEKL